MIGKAERKDRMYKILLRQILTFAFISARCGNGMISLNKLFVKFEKLNHSDIVSFMDESMMRDIFRREITGDGIVYRLTANFRYAEFDVVNTYVNKQLKKAEKK